MARLWNVGNGEGEEVGVPTVKRRDFDGKVKDFVKVPALHAGNDDTYVEHSPGNVYLSLPGYTFYTIPKGAFWDVPPGVSLKAIKSMAPHLVTQEEYESAQDAEPLAEEPKADAKIEKKK